MIVRAAQPWSTQAPGTAMGVFAFRVIRQMQQLGQRIDVRFTIHDDQALQAIPGIFQ